MVWFLLRRVFECLLVRGLADTFKDCHSWHEVWQVLEALSDLQVVGVVVIVAVVVCSVLEMVAYLFKLLRKRRR